MSTADRAICVVLYAPAADPQEALDGLAEALIAGGYPVPECVGPSAAASLFAKIWSDRTGQAAVKKTAQRIYELSRVVLPRNVAGSPRLPRIEDLDLLARWTQEFSLEVGEQSDSEAARKSAEQVIANSQALFWEHQGEPVSMAAALRQLPHGVAISRVYTPPEHRGHGFASVCVAELSQRQLNAGRHFCCLYTDLANPTSNSIYQKIGYTAVADSSHFRFLEKQQMTEPDNIKFREFRPGDLPVVYELLMKTADISFQGVYAPSAIRHCKEHNAREQILADAREGYTVVLESDGRIIGTGTLVDDKIARVYVNPPDQGCGLGKRIMDLLEQRARADSREQLFLHSTIVAKRFYESLGYHIEAEKSSEMEDGQPLKYFDMVKHLKDGPL